MSIANRFRATLACLMLLAAPHLAGAQVLYGPAAITGGTIKGADVTGAMVTPTGGSLMKLGDALANSGGACTTNCTIQTLTVPTALNVTGTAATVGIVDTSGPSGTGVQTTGPLAFGGGPITANQGQGGVFNNTVAYNSIATEIRSRYISDSVTNNTGSGIDEGFYFERRFFGSATYANEVNGFHVYLTDLAGMTFTAANNENFEASTQWNGAHASVSSFTALPVFSTTGTLTGTGYGFVVAMTNQNTTPGSMANFVGFDYLPYSGGGAVPTSHFAFQNRDPTATSGFSGPVVVGSIAAGNAAQMLYIQGPDTSGSTFPLLIKSNNGGTFVFSVNDAGSVQAWNSLVVGSSGLTGGSIAFQNATSGSIHVNPPTGALGNAILTLPDVTGIIATINTAQSWSGKQAMAASVTGGATFSILPGTAPTSPVNGDMWSTSSGFFGWSNGALVTFGGGGAVASVSNSDSTLTISPTTGSVIASLNLANANTWTGNQIVQGPDNTSATIPFRVLNQAGVFNFSVRDDGAVTMANGPLTIGTAGTTQGGLVLATTTAGVQVKILPSNSIAAGSIIAIPGTVGTADTFALLGTSQTFSAAIVTATGTWDFTGTIKAGAAGTTQLSTAAAPTSISGFGTSPSISAGGSVAWFQITVGTGGTATSGTITFGGVAHGWNCNPTETTGSAPSTVYTRAYITSSNTIGFVPYSISTNAVTAWPAGDVLTVSCAGG